MADLALSNSGEESLRERYHQLRREGLDEVLTARKEGAFVGFYPLAYVPGLDKLRESAELAKHLYPVDFDGIVHDIHFEIGAILQPIAHALHDRSLLRGAGEEFLEAGCTLENTVQQIVTHRRKNWRLGKSVRKAKLSELKRRPTRPDLNPDDRRTYGDLRSNELLLREKHLTHLRTSYLRASECYASAGDNEEADAAYVKQKEATGKLMLYSLHEQWRWDVAANALFHWFWGRIAQYGTSWARWIVISSSAVGLFSLMYWHTPSWLPGWLSVLEFENGASTVGDAIFLSVTAFLGFGWTLTSPTNLAAKATLASEVLLGYVMLGFLITIIFRQLMR